MKNKKVIDDKIEFFMVVEFGIMFVISLASCYGFAEWTGEIFGGYYFGLMANAMLVLFWVKMNEDKKK